MSNKKALAQTETREAPAEREAVTYSDLMQAVVNRAQFEILRGKTPDYAIQIRPDNGFKYVQHGYVRDQLNRAFGFDYDFKCLSVFNGKPYDIQTQTVNNKPVENLVVLGELTVRIRNPKNVQEILTTIVKQDFGSHVWRNKIELGDSLKAATSDAFKRCALGLGVANDLYWSDEEKWLAHEAKNGNGLTGKTPTSLAELISKAQNELGLSAVQVAEKLSVTSIIEVKDFENAWSKLNDAGWSK